jgi:hypothetical protein
MRALVVHLDRVPDLVCAGITQPTDSFLGAKLCDLSNANEISPAVCLSILANAKDRGAAVFTWRHETGGAAQALIASLQSLERRRIPDAIVRFAFEMFENTYFRKTWWEGLSPKVQNVALRRMQNNFSNGDPSLTEDGVEFVNWNVTNIVAIG